MKDKINQFLAKQSKAWKQKIRIKAAAAAKENVVRFGRNINDYTQYEWMQIVKKEEDLIIKHTLKNGGIGAIIFGFAPWW